MKDYLVDAIVLKSVRAREADRVITMYTRQAGKKRAIAHGAEKPTSRKRGAVQPFSYSRLLLRRGRDLDAVSQGEGLEIFPAIRQSLEGLAAASCLAEMVDSFTLEEDPNTRVFDLLLDTFRLLGGKWDFVASRAFEIKFVSLLGYSPGLDECVVCGAPVEGDRVAFLPGQGGIACPDCRKGPAGAVIISRGSLENIRALMRWETGRVHQIRLDPASGSEIREVMRQFIEYHLEKGIKSRKFQDLVNGK